MAETKKDTEKKEVAKTATPAKVEKKTEVKPAAAKPAKKAEPVKAAAKPAAKAEAKPAVKAEAKVAAKPSAKAETAKPAAKTAAKAEKADAKATAKKPEVKKSVPAKKEKSEKGKLPYVSDGEIRVELVKSTNGCTVKQIRTVQALGLRKINEVRVHKDNPAIRGMCNLISHLVKVEKVS